MDAVRRLVRLLLFQVGRTADRAAKLAHYLAGGTLSLHDLQDGMRDAWQGHYRLGTENTRGLMPWEQDVVDRFVRPGADVLLIGCGNGRDVVALAERGCRVTGVEPSERALQTARRVLGERRLSATLVEGFFEETPLPGPFDVVMFSYYCYIFMPESRRRVTALRKAAAALRPGGAVVVSVCWYPVRPRAILVHLARLMGALCRTDWRVEPGDMVWDNRGSRPAFSYSHAFEPGDVEREAAAAGLRPVFTSDTGDGRVLVLAPP